MIDLPFMLLGFSVVAFMFVVFWAASYGRIFTDTLLLRDGREKGDIFAFIISWAYVLASASLPIQLIYLR